MKPTTTAAHLLFACLVVAVLAVPATGAAAEPAATAPAGETTTGAAPVPQPEGNGQTTTGPATTTTPQPTTTTTPVPATPQVQGQFSQRSSPGAPPPRHAAHPRQGSQPAAPGEGTETAARPGGPKAVSPATLTPNLPLGLGATLGGIPSFFIESFGIPPFLLPIFQAAGTAYGVPWQVLAAINQVETDYGRDLSVSSAGAEGWMQFLPASWAQYGVDANGDGYKDPYNPADAIFAAARYLRAAGGDTNIRAAVFAYNHAQAYVDSVMLRAQLLGGSPAELLGALTALTEARFPVHAAAHFSDGFPTVVARGSGRPTTLVGTSIYAQAGAPVIAVQDGEVVQIGESSTLGRFVVLRDAFGNTYTYARLGPVASLYPVLQPHLDTQVSPRIHAAAPHEAAPSGPATAGVQPRSPLSEGATVSGLAFGAAAGLEAAPPAASAPAAPATTPAPAPPARVRVFRSGANDVYLHALHAGVQVIAGTVLGHVGAGEGGGAEGQPHIVFQIRPTGAGAPQIDPKPILDGWVALESSSIFRAKGENPFLATSPTVGQVLLESKQQLEPQVLRDAGIKLGRCGRQDVQGGRVDRRVLAMLEYMSVSALRPTLAGLPCAPSTPAALAANAPAGAGAVSVRITAVNGIPVAGHQEPGSVADTAVRKLLMLQGASRPQRIVSLLSYPGVKIAQTGRAGAGAILVDYPTPLVRGAHAADAGASALSPSEWVGLIARLGEIPDPTVAHAPTAAAIPDTAGAVASEGLAHGHH
jgi:murein DD-endopeptidase MepM/ murein hydrolase activator NlpD